MTNSTQFAAYATDVDLTVNTGLPIDVRARLRNRAEGSALRSNSLGVLLGPYPPGPLPGGHAVPVATPIFATPAPGVSSAAVTVSGGNTTETVRLCIAVTKQGALAPAFRSTIAEMGEWSIDFYDATDTNVLTTLDLTTTAARQTVRVDEAGIMPDVPAVDVTTYTPGSTEVLKHPAAGCTVQMRWRVALAPFPSATRSAFPCTLVLPPPPAVTPPFGPFLPEQDGLTIAGGGERELEGVVMANGIATFTARVRLPWGTDAFGTLSPQDVRVALSTTTTVTASVAPGVPELVNGLGVAEYLDTLSNNGLLQSYVNHAPLLRVLFDAGEAMGDADGTGVLRARLSLQAASLDPVPLVTTDTVWPLQLQDATAAVSTDIAFLDGVAAGLTTLPDDVTHLATGDAETPVAFPVLHATANAAASRVATLVLGTVEIAEDMGTGAGDAHPVATEVVGDSIVTSAGRRMRGTLASPHGVGAAFGDALDATGAAASVVGPRRAALANAFATGALTPLGKLSVYQATRRTR